MLDAKNLKELKAILRNAPDGSTHHCHRNFYWLLSKNCDDSTGSSFLFYSSAHEKFLKERVTDENIRSLSDIKKQVILLERIKVLEESIENSNKITVNDFDYIFIEDDAENVKDIMMFCGVEQSDIEQEMIFHAGGDNYICLGNMDVHQLERNYLVKRNDEIISYSECDFKHLFKVVD